MGCNNKVKQTCTKTFAVCTMYEGSVSEHTLLEQVECLEIQEVIEDLYNIIDVIKEETDVTTLENTCITFTSPKTVASVIEQMYSKICEMQELITIQGETIVTMQEEIVSLQENLCP